MKEKLKVMTIFGTRPEAIKMAPLVKELEKHSDLINTRVCVTAQHRQMLDQVLNIFSITPDHDLNIMQDKQSLTGITTRGLENLSNVLSDDKPDIVLVHGDTTTTFIGSLAAFYNNIQVGHVEAGLRTGDKHFPFPEEMNRKLTGVLADMHFAPTLNNRKNLLAEGYREEDIFITGNTVIDALKSTVYNEYVFALKELLSIDFDMKKVITVTAHRRENLGEPLENICLALKKILETHQDVEIVYPVHLNPAVKEVAARILGNHPRAHLIPPLDVQDMHNLINRSYFVMTDSGGLQEEAPSLGKPVLVLRNETERPEAIMANTVKIAGTRCDTIFYLADELLTNQETYDQMKIATNPYGDGKASKRIVDALLYRFNYSKVFPEEFTV